MDHIKKVGTVARSGNYLHRKEKDRFAEGTGVDINCTDLNRLHFL